MTCVVGVVFFYAYVHLAADYHDWYAFLYLCFSPPVRSLFLVVTSLALS